MLPERSLIYIQLMAKLRLKVRSYCSETTLGRLGAVSISRQSWPDKGQYPGDG